MLITFSCEGCENITMFGDVAKRLLKMMGYSEDFSGLVTAEDVPTVLLRLKESIEVEKDEPPSNAESNHDKDSKDQSISIAQRAYPLLEMLDMAAKEKHDVTWKVT